MLSKEQFVEAMNAIKSQYEHDRFIAEKLAEVYPQSYPANLMYENAQLISALVKVLQICMNDMNEDSEGNTWITYFMHELDFGRENYRLKVYEGEEEVPMRIPEELYEYLTRKR